MAVRSSDKVNTNIANPLKFSVFFFEILSSLDRDFILTVASYCAAKKIMTKQKNI